MNWESEEERLALLAEVIREQNGTASYKPPQAPEIHNPPNVFRQLARTDPSPRSHRKAYRRITIDAAGQIQPAKPPKPKPEGKPAEPEDKRPRGERKPPEPTDVSLAIARYLARPKGEPEKPTAPVKPPEPMAEAPRRQPTATHRTERKPRPMDSQDIKALEWLKRMGHR